MEQKQWKSILSTLDSESPSSLESHGLSILKSYIASLIEEEECEEEPQFSIKQSSYYDIMKSKDFCEFLALYFLQKIKINFALNGSQLKRLLSAVYLRNDKDLFCQDIETIIDKAAVQMFIEGTYKEVLQNPQINIIEEQQTQTKELETNEENKLLQERLKLFKEQEEVSSEVEDAISEIQNIKNKNVLISFESETRQHRNNTFICFYRSKALFIPEVMSEPKPRKKEAQHQAAKKFLPHLLFYLKYKKPFFQTDEEEQEYLSKITLQKQSSNSDNYNPEDKEKSRSNSGSSSNRSSDEAKVEEYDLRKDFEMAEKYQEEVKTVYVKVQKSEVKNGTDVIDVKHKEVIHGIFSCIVSFFQEQKIVFSCEGRASSKKAAKEVAFMKLCPLVIEYYNQKEGEESKQANGRIGNRLRKDYPNYKQPYKYYNSQKNFYNGYDQQQQQSQQQQFQQQSSWSNSNTNGSNGSFSNSRMRSFVQCDGYNSFNNQVQNQNFNDLNYSRPHPSQISASNNFKPFQPLNNNANNTNNNTFLRNNYRQKNLQPLNSSNSGKSLVWIEKKESQSNYPLPNYPVSNLSEIEKGLSISSKSATCNSSDQSLNIIYNNSSGLQQASQQQQAPTTPPPQPPQQIFQPYSRQNMQPMNYQSAPFYPNVNYLNFTPSPLYPQPNQFAMQQPPQTRNNNRNRYPFNFAPFQPMSQYEELDY